MFSTLEDISQFILCLYYLILKCATEFFLNAKKDDRFIQFIRIRSIIFVGAMYKGCRHTKSCAIKIKIKMVVL